MLKPRESEESEKDSLNKGRWNGRLLNYSSHSTRPPNLQAIYFGNYSGLPSTRSLTGQVSGRVYRQVYRREPGLADTGLCRIFGEKTKL